MIHTDDELIITQFKQMLREHPYQVLFLQKNLGKQQTISVNPFSGDRSFLGRQLTLMLQTSFGNQSVELSSNSQHLSPSHRGSKMVGAAPYK